MPSSSDDLSLQIRQHFRARLSYDAVTAIVLGIGYAAMFEEVGVRNPGAISVVMFLAALPFVHAARHHHAELERLRARTAITATGRIHHR